ncbi:MAG: 3-methyl-2-oxobutanoate hydroxymethyltransferase [Firmicutes bacterium HGW-Firmicutes-12]|jgi:3-methyl-2-oxobutanoate hydroxymethyltransferase|nr:MAG: 3-methyl-2-oxobutanoate hydroxymethyltransferase [Firmicutes bacterium HGW-Firmicutes-12]
MSKLGIADFYKMKQEKKKISMVTAYDYGMMSLIDQTDIDMVLVGDSAATVMFGLDSTVSVTMDAMINMCAMVSRAASNTYVVGDMPYMSYELGIEKALDNAGRLMKEGFVDAVKLEGGTRIKNTIKALVDVGIPVMGHIGLTPQTASQLGGYKVQGKDFLMATQIIEDAFAVQEAGVFCVGLEAIPAPLAKIITESLNIPTIGIGAGVNCDGQVLILHDLLGMFDRFVPKFVKRYAELGQEIREALNRFTEEVRSSSFPDKEHSYNMDKEVENKLTEYIKNRNGK